ncbi:hypothetical protein CUMW_059270 [Citrus unshiu]|nr:hypothetical protein CUMW_059270 [Citrus unshiu]
MSAAVKPEQTSASSLPEQSLHTSFCQNQTASTENCYPSNQICSQYHHSKTSLVQILRGYPKFEDLCGLPKHSI